MAAKKARWQQRFENFDKAYLRFADAIKDGIEHVSELSDLEKTGVVKHFEFTFQLAKDVLSDYLQENGDTTYSSKQLIRRAYKDGYIRDGEVWIEALTFRSKAAHVYSGDILQDVLRFACNKFFPVLRDMRNYFKQEYDECDSD